MPMVHVKRKKSTKVSDPLLAKLNVERVKLAKTRDALRAIAEDAKELADSANEALETLDQTVDTLSKYV